MTTISEVYVLTFCQQLYEARELILATEQHAKLLAQTLAESTLTQRVSQPEAKVH